MATPKKLTLIGYGKMGKLIDALAPEYGFEVASRINSSSGDRSFPGVDVAIDFSTPESAPANLKALADARVPSVCGTTGWLEQLPIVSKAFKTAGVGLVWSPNFSVGVAVFRRISALASELLKNQPEYGCWAWEIHHSTKKDAPSGTLLQLVETMRQQGYRGAIDVTASRAGKHPGTHEIGFDSAADTITLRHSARNREGFARGALKSAAWIIGRTGIHTFDDVLFGGPSS